MKLKKILFGLAMFLTIGNITVNAQNEVTVTGASEDYTVVGGNHQEAHIGYNINAVCNTDLSFKLDYSIENGDYKTFTYNEEFPDGVFRCNAGQNIELTKSGVVVTQNDFNTAETAFNLRITPSGNENLEPIYFTQKQFIFEETEKIFGDNLIWLGSIWLPLNTTSHAEKVEDPAILNELKSYDVYRLSLEADGKDLGYYIEKYYKKFDITFLSYVTSYKLPANIAGNEYKLYAYSKNLEGLKMGAQNSTPSGHNDGLLQLELENIDDYYKIYDNGYVAFKSEDSEANYIPLTVTTRETIEVPNTSAKVKLIVILSGIILAIIGTSILSKNLSKQINE